MVKEKVLEELGCIKSKVKQRQKEEKNEENKIIIHCAIGFLA